MLELFEIQAEEGPCLDCYRTGEPVVNQDLAAPATPLAPFRVRGARRRLPLRARPAHAVAGCRHRRAQPLPRDPGEMRRADLDAAQALADVATIGILQHRLALEAQTVNAQLEHALNSRIVIEQAKGMVAERTGVSLEEAFKTLRDHARSHNLRLADLARDVATGALGASALQHARAG